MKTFNVIRIKRLALASLLALCILPATSFAQGKGCEDRGDCGDERTTKNNQDVVTKQNPNDPALTADKPWNAESTGEKKSFVSKVGSGVVGGFQYLGRQAHGILSLLWGGSKWLGSKVVDGAEDLWDGTKWVGGKVKGGAKVLYADAKIGACFARNGVMVATRGGKSGFRWFARKSEDGAVLVWHATDESISALKRSFEEEKDPAKRAEKKKAWEDAKKHRKEQRELADKQRKANHKDLPDCTPDKDEKTEAAKVADNAVTPQPQIANNNAVKDTSIAPTGTTFNALTGEWENSQFGGGFGGYGTGSALGFRTY